MSLIITLYVPSGIVMAGDSRVTVRRTQTEGRTRVQQQLVHSDNAYSIVRLRRVPMGIGVYDYSFINNQPAESILHRFESEALEDDDDVDAVADKLLEYFNQHHAGASLGFHLAGFRREGRSSTPVILVGHTTREPRPRRINMREDGTIQYGIGRAGDTGVVNRLIDEKNLPLFDAMPLQDAIDYAVHLIRSTIETLRFEPRFSTVGGPIDVLVVRPDGPLWIQRKELHGYPDANQVN